MGRSNSRNDVNLETSAITWIATTITTRDPALRNQNVKVTPAVSGIQELLPSWSNTHLPQPPLRLSPIGTASLTKSVRQQSAPFDTPKGHAEDSLAVKNRNANCAIILIENLSIKDRRQLKPPVTTNSSQEANSMVDFPEPQAWETLHQQTFLGTDRISHLSPEEDMDPGIGLPILVCKQERQRQTKVSKKRDPLNVSGSLQEENKVATTDSSISSQESANKLPVNNKEKLRIVQWNCRSLNNKDKVEYTKSLNADLTLLQEIWQHGEAINVNLNSLYTIERKNLRGGGTAALSKEDTQFTILKDIPINKDCSILKIRWKNNYFWLSAKEQFRSYKNY